jgi:hypothetical protein
LGAPVRGRGDRNIICVFVFQQFTVVMIRRGSAELGCERLVPSSDSCSASQQVRVVQPVAQAIFFCGLRAWPAGLSQRIFSLPVAARRAPGAAGSLRPATGGLKISWAEPLPCAHLWGLYRAVEFPARQRGGRPG